VSLPICRFRALVLFAAMVCAGGCEYRTDVPAGFAPLALPPAFDASRGDRAVAVSMTCSTGWNSAFAMLAEHPEQHVHHDQVTVDRIAAIDPQNPRVWLPPTRSGILWGLAFLKSDDPTLAIFSPGRPPAYVDYRHETSGAIRLDLYVKHNVQWRDDAGDEANEEAFAQLLDMAPLWNQLRARTREPQAREPIDVLARPMIEAARARETNHPELRWTPAQRKVLDWCASQAK
jgi:hypothetical protein